MKVLLAAFPILVVAAAGAASTFVKVRDGLMQERAAMAAGWTGVDQALQERAALIRELAEAVQGSGVPVDRIAADIAKAQSELLAGATPQERIRAHDRLSTALARLLEAQDAHRPTKTGAGQPRLEELIKDSEAKIAVARRKYNETLEHYNARIQTFPNNLVAKLAGFRRNDAYFRTEPF